MKRRRQFLKASALAGAAVSLGGLTPRPSAAAQGAADADLPPAPSWIERPMRWAQLTLVEDEAKALDVPFWLDYFRAHALGRRLPERRRLRRLLPDRGAVPPPQRVARRPRRVRRAGRRLPRARHGRHRPHRSARDLRRRAGGAPRLDRGGRGRQAAPPLGLAGDVGHLRPRALQLRVHDRGEARDHGPLPRWTASSSTAGTGRARATASTAGRNFRAATGLELPRTDGPARPGAARLHAVAAAAALRACGSSGTARSARSTPTPASSPTPAAAPPARST